MPRDILSEFGSDSPHPQASRATRGGVMECKDLPYSPPIGPKSINYERPGLGGGENHGNCGTQGHHGNGTQTSSSPGLHDRNHGMGTNRRG